jgi:N-acetylmuramoyl-L-alanine amidase
LHKISPYEKYGDIFMKMNKIICFSFITALLVLSLHLNEIHAENNQYKVVIDAGHGGYDGGAEGDHTVEKDINLQIAYYLKNYLTDLGVEVIMIRDSDEAFNRKTRGTKKQSDLSYRLGVINESNADLFVSIHMNAMNDNRWRGSQTFYYPSHEANKALGEALQKNLTDVLKNTHRKAKPIKSLYLLKKAEITGALIECGFLSNPEEEQLLSTPAYQEKVALAIYLGLLDFWEAN